MLLPFSCPAVVCNQSKPRCNKLLRFYFFSMKDAKMFSILSLETTSFSVLNDISYTFYHILYILVKVIKSICATLWQSLNCTLTLRSLWTAQNREGSCSKLSILWHELILGRRQKKHVLLSKQVAIPAVNQVALICTKSIGILPPRLLQKCSSLPKFIYLFGNLLAIAFNGIY